MEEDIPEVGAVLDKLGERHLDGLPACNRNPRSAIVASELPLSPSPKHLAVTSICHVGLRDAATMTVICHCALWYG